MFARGEGIASQLSKDGGGAGGATHDAMVPCCLQDLLDDGALLCATVCEPAAKREERDLETGGAQVPELHVLWVVGGADGWLSHGCG
jgi:hypothetical protein